MSLSGGNQGCSLEAKIMLKTPQVEDLMLAVQQWLWVGTPGGFVYGNPRVGKTTGIKYASESISTRSGGSVPFIYYSVQRDQRKTDKKFWSAILLALRKDITHTRTAIALYEQLMGQIDIISRQNMERQVILCIDEAQDLSLQELRWLICLHNDLLHQGTNLLVTQVGTLELKDRQKKLFGPETDHIKGRFFNSEYRFHGVRTRNELQQILLIFDDPTAWLGSQTPSSFYLLESCLQGAKLCDLLPFFWRIWTDKIKPSGYSEWPTFYLIGAIRTFFLDFVHRIPHSEDVESYIYGAVKASGILPE